MSRNITPVFLIITAIISVQLALTSPLFADNRKNVQYYNSGKSMQAGLPFSEIVRVGNMLYLSGQLGVKPGTLELVPGGMKQQARQTMENIKLALESNGFSMSNIVKCTVMLDDISQWGAFNEVYKTFFTKPYPARSAFGADGLGLGALLEVECIGAV